MLPIGLPATLSTMWVISYLALALPGGPRSSYMAAHGLDCPGRARDVVEAVQADVLAIVQARFGPAVAVTLARQ